MSGVLSVFDVARLLGSTAQTAERNRVDVSAPEPYEATPDYWEASDENVIVFDSWVRMNRAMGRGEKERQTTEEGRER